MKRFFLALRFLTVWPFGSDGEVTAEDLATSTVYYPLVGAILGFVLYGFYTAAQRLWPVLAAAVLTVVLWELLSAGLHLDGLIDTFDGLGVRGDRERRLAVMKDSRAGAFGVQAAVLSLLLKVATVAGLAERPAAGVLLLLAPVFGRTAMVVLMGTCSYARDEAGLGKVFLEQTGTGRAVLAVVLALLIGVAAAGVRVFLPAAFLAVFFLLLRSFFNLNFGGVTGDILGAACELHELAALLLAPLLFV
ncbi:MAG: adenosylcobinamide-GDP ribazoletransferase [Firmicutes bacterium]|jgi:adenosylcobinamide-GDP ribazoletransferase|nr:adenosylcobinamide-GDP ribazoletransferase [Bacillota bacterium]